MSIIIPYPGTLPASGQISIADAVLMGASAAGSKPSPPWTFSTVSGWLGTSDNANSWHGASVAYPSRYDYTTGPSVNNSNSANWTAAVGELIELQLLAATVYQGQDQDNNAIWADGSAGFTLNSINSGYYKFMSAVDGGVDTVNLASYSGPTMPFYGPYYCSSSISISIYVNGGLNAGLISGTAYFRIMRVS